MTGPLIPPLTAPAASVTTAGSLHPLAGLTPPPSGALPPGHGPLLHYTFPSQEDTLAYVDALKHSDLSQWRSLEEVAARAGGGSCSGAITTSVLTALYLLGLFNLCAASPASCCVPPATGRRRRRHVSTPLPFLMNTLQQNLSAEVPGMRYDELPAMARLGGGLVPVHVSVVEQVRQLWNSNPRLLSNVACRTATESVRSSFISLSGVASGIILAYSVAQLNQCYPDLVPGADSDSAPPKIWFFPIPKPQPIEERKFLLPSVTSYIPVPGEDEPSDGCERSEVVLEDGRCAALLSAAPCPYRHWVLLNRDTRKGECVPRLCGEGRVYVQEDQLCHDINEAGICPESQRLYLDAFGKANCDCPDGMFPGPSGKCHVLYDPAYCAQGTVMQFHKPSKTLMCGKDPCGHVNANLWPDDLPFAPRDDGFCYQFNEQGPCSTEERFGFNTEVLQAQCVSMLEAGLVRPKRSYMYSHMSYQATADQPSPHYQVSYVILNGSTWGLEVKGVGRDRRQPRDTQSSSLGPRLPFIDTRTIPTQLETFLSSLYAPEGQRNTIDGFPLPDEDGDDACLYGQEDIHYEDCGFMGDGGEEFDLDETTQTSHDTDGDYVSAGEGGNGTTDFREIISNEVTLDHEPTTPITTKLTRKQRVQKLMQISRTQIETEQGSGTEETESDSTAEMTLEMSTTEKSQPISTTPPLTTPFLEPRTIEDIIKRLLTPRLRIIDTLSHPRRRKPQLATFSTGLFDKNPEIVLESTTERVPTSLFEVLPRVSEGEVLRVDQDEPSRATVKASLTSSSPLPNSTVEIIKVDQNVTPRPTTTTEKSTPTLTSSPATTSSTTQTSRAPHTPPPRRRGDITVAVRRGRRRPNRNRRRRGRRRRKMISGNKSRRASARRRRNRKESRKRKNPNLPVRVPVVKDVVNTTVITTTPTVAPLLSSSGTDSTVTELFNHTQYHVTQTEQVSTTTSSPTTTTSKAGRASKKKPSGMRRPSGARQPLAGGNGQSLTDYLRHRDRRQLTGGGGIIQAPLLSACKPGAKRDYNYKCRPKFIPQERSRRDSDTSSEVPSPVPPRIKCPEGTQLDPRGKCQAASNLLG